MHVSEGKPVVNTEAGEKMSANDFYLDIEDIAELNEAGIIEMCIRDRNGADNQFYGICCMRGTF